MSRTMPVKHLSYQKEDRLSLMTSVMVNLSDQLDILCVSVGVLEQNQWLLVSPVPLGDLGSVVPIQPAGSTGSSCFLRS